MEPPNKLASEKKRLLNSITTLMAMASLPAKPSTGGMFYHVSVCFVMNYCFTEHSKCNGREISGKKAVHTSTKKLVYKCGHIFDKGFITFEARCSTGIMYSQGLNKRSNHLEKIFWNKFWLPPHPLPIGSITVTKYIHSGF